jgi:hypothetical protein
MNAIRSSALFLAMLGAIVSSNKISDSSRVGWGLNEEGLDVRENAQWFRIVDAGVLVEGCKVFYLG